MSKAPTVRRPEDPGSGKRDAVLGELDAYFSRRVMPDGSMDRVVLDGFITAVAVGPMDADIGDAAPAVWNHDAAFTATAQAEELVGLLYARQLEISDQLLLLDDHALVLQSTPDAEPDPHTWCRGFMAGFRIFSDYWIDFIKDDRYRNFLGPVGALASTESHQIEEDFGIPAEEQAAFLEEAKVLLPGAVRAIHESWLEIESEDLPISNEELDELTADLVEPYVPHTERPVRKIKIGRNAPCPCGSGKKYKRCCGAG